MLRRTILHFAAVLLVTLVTSTHSAKGLARIDETIYVDLPAQTLTQSIIDIGKSSKISIVVPSHLLKGLSAPAVSGRFTTRELLDTLLANSPLTFREVNKRVLVIVRRNTEKSERFADDVIVEELIIVGRQITGSFLGRIDLQGSSPVDIITKQELDISGSQNVAEFLKSIPAVSGNSTSTALSNGGDGTATVTLRGLPANNTLVLLNGRRINPEGLNGNSVDLNSIPSAIVERIEILKDGASAIYGTDAIAGVVNIILKREYEGAQFEQYLGTSYKSDLETVASHLLWGKSSDRSSFLISGQFFDQNGLFSRDRPTSSNADGRNRGGIDKRSTATPNSRIVINDMTITLDNNATGVEESDFRLASDEEDRFNFLSQTSTISPSNRQNIYTSAQFALSDAVTLSADAGFNRTEATITLASTPIFTAFETEPIIVSADNIYNPFNADVTDVRRRVTELPPREQENIAEAYRFGLTLDGYTDSADWSINAIWNETQARETVVNLLSEARVRRALGSSRDCQSLAIDGCEPLNLFGPAGSITTEQLNYIRSGTSIRGITRLYGINGNISGRLLDLPAGSLYAALGFDWRREEVDSRPIPETDDVNIGNVSRGATTGARRISEAFVETQIPLLRRRLFHSLDLELALRHSYYSDFGDNTSPKFGLMLRPVPQLLIRSTYSEGFRAPNLGELFTESFQSQLPLTDLCSFRENVGVLPGCPLQSDDTRIQYLVTFAGEPDLKPETSQSYTIGLVWTPRIFNELYISLDHFHIDQQDIVSANAQLVLNRNARFNEFPDFVTRDENGDVTGIFSPFINIGEREVRGVDTSIRYISRSEHYGTLSYSLNASYLDKYAFKLDENSDYEDLQGTFEDAANEGAGALPRWKANTGIFWARDRVEFGYSINYISSLQEKIPFTEHETRKIESWFTHDTQFSYRAGHKKQIKLTLGVDNIFNESPPFSAAAFNDNYDARTYDIRGQFWYGRVVFSL